MMDYLTHEWSECESRGVYSSAYSAEEVIYETRQLLAELFHFSKCKNVIFYTECYHQSQFHFKRILRPGDHILVSSMEQCRYAASSTAGF